MDAVFSKHQQSRLFVAYGAQEAAREATVSANVYQNANVPGLLRTLDEFDMTHRGHGDPYPFGTL